jgi:hypothetical protein
MDKKEAPACAARDEGATLQHTDGAADRDGPRYQDRDQVPALHATGHCSGSQCSETSTTAKYAKNDQLRPDWRARLLSGGVGAMRQCFVARDPPEIAILRGVSPNGGAPSIAGSACGWLTSSWRGLVRGDDHDRPTLLGVDAGQPPLGI